MMVNDNTDDKEILDLRCKSLTSLLRNVKNEPDLTTSNKEADSLRAIVTQLPTYLPPSKSRSFSAVQTHDASRFKFYGSSRPNESCGRSEPEYALGGCPECQKRTNSNSRYKFNKNLSRTKKVCTCGTSPAVDSIKSKTHSAASLSNVYKFVKQPNVASNVNDTVSGNVPSKTGFKYSIYSRSAYKYSRLPASTQSKTLIHDQAVKTSSKTRSVHVNHTSSELCGSSAQGRDILSRYRFIRGKSTEQANDPAQYRFTRGKLTEQDDGTGNTRTFWSRSGREASSYASQRTFSSNGFDYPFKTNADSFLSKRYNVVRRNQMTEVRYKKHSQFTWMSSNQPVEQAASFNKWHKTTEFIARRSNYILNKARKHPKYIRNYTHAKSIAKFNAESLILERRGEKFRVASDRRSLKKYSLPDERPSTRKRKRSIHRTMGVVKASKALVRIPKPSLILKRSTGTFKLTKDMRQLTRVSSTEASASYALPQRQPFTGDDGRFQYKRSSMKFVRSGVVNAKRICASQVLKRSVWHAHKKNVSSKRYCMFFNKFGKCKKENLGCPYIHDKERVAICTRFLKGKCSDEKCLFTHKQDRSKMPVCMFFLRGSCTNEKCLYAHVNVGKNASICEDFLKGYCPLGEECSRKHIVECEEFRLTGACANRKSCKLTHRVVVKRARRRPSGSRPPKYYAKHMQRNVPVGDRDIHRRILPRFIHGGIGEDSSEARSPSKDASVSSSITATAALSIASSSTVTPDTLSATSKSTLNGYTAFSNLFENRSTTEDSLFHPNADEMDQSQGLADSGAKFTTQRRDENPRATRRLPSLGEFIPLDLSRDLSRDLSHESGDETDEVPDSEDEAPRRKSSGRQRRNKFSLGDDFVSLS